MNTSLETAKSQLRELILASWLLVKFLCLPPELAP
jgi:hypothetical protein